MSSRLVRAARAPLASSMLRRAVCETLESRRLLAIVPLFNPSFEEPGLTDGQSTTSVPGWLLNGWVSGAESGVGIRNPAAGQFPNPVPDGSNALHAWADGASGVAEGPIEQTLDVTVQADTIYTLRYWLSETGAFQGRSAGIRLWYGPGGLDPLPEIGSQWDPATGYMTVSHSVGAGNPAIGQSLTLRAEFWLSSYEGAAGVAFDDVRLHAGTGQQSYFGSPHAVPGLIEAENFDHGGEGVAYHDTTAGNASSVYRDDEDVDVDVARNADGGYRVHRTKAGEWLEYTVDVPVGGSFELATRLASYGNGASFHWEVDGVDATGSIAVPNTGGTWSYEWVRRTVSLSAGTHVLRLAMDAEGVWPDGTSSSVADFDAFALTDVSAAPAAPSGLSAAGAFPTRVDLAWADNTANETDQELQRSSDGGVTWTTVRTLRGNVIAHADTGLTAGTTYQYQLRASNSGGQSAWTPVAIATTPATATFPYKVNFQVDSTPPVPGYKVDSGRLFGDRGDGLSYGWDMDHTLLDRERGIGIDRRRDTLVHFREGATWELDLPSGTYDVTVSVGDSAYASTYTLNAEGVNYWDALPLAKNTFGLLTRTVSVTDGRLTLDQGDAPAKATRINYIEIAPTGGTVTVPAAPTNLRATPTDTTITLEWDDNATNENGFIVERWNFATSLWEEIGGTAADVRTTGDRGLTAETDYRYRIGAFNTAGTTYSPHLDTRTTTPTVKPVVTIETTGDGATAAEVLSGSGPPDPGEFTFTRTEPNLAQELIVYFDVHGDTTAQTNDYTLSGTAFTAPDRVTFPANETVVTLTLNVTDDTREEGNESVVLALRGDGGYDRGSPNADDVTIVDDEEIETPGEFQLSTAVVSAEGIDLDWAPVDGAAEYLLEVSFDGTTYNQSTKLSADGFSADVRGLDENMTVWHRVTALDAGGATLKTSNAARATTFPDPEESLAPQGLVPAAAAASAPPLNILASWYGIDTNGELSDGDVRVEAIGDAFERSFTKEVLRQDSNNDGDTYGEAYPWNAGKQAFLDLMKRLDGRDGNAPDKTITQAETEDVHINFLAFSWGSITAVNISRVLTASRKWGYTLNVDVPVDSIVVMDPIHSGPARQVRWVWHSGVLSNTARFVNYYQTKGGYTSIATGPALGIYSGTDQLGNPFSSLLKGTTLPSSIGNTTQYNITTDPLWKDRIVEHNYENSPGAALTYGKGVGKEMNHVALPWYVMTFAMPELDFGGYTTTSENPLDSWDFERLSDI